MNPDALIAHLCTTLFGHEYRLQVRCGEGTMLIELFAKPPAICLLTIAPYADSLAPMDEPGVHQVAGWSPAVGAFIQVVASGSDQVATIEAIDL